jgi:hypothetical protein
VSIELAAHSGLLVLFTAFLIAATASHYVASGLALQAAAGVQLPSRERYLTQRGSSPSCAVAAIGVLQVLGAVADISVLATLCLLGSALGDAPDGGWARLAREIETPVRVVTQHPALAVALALLLAAFALHRRRAGRVVDGVLQPCGLASLGSVLAGLRGRPRDVAMLVGASAWTTLVLAVGFAASVAAVAGASLRRRGAY